MCSVTASMCSKKQTKKQRTKSISRCAKQKCSCHLPQEATCHRTETILMVIKNSSKTIYYLQPAKPQQAYLQGTWYCSLPGMPGMIIPARTLLRPYICIGPYDGDTIVRSDGCFLHYFCTLTWYLVIKPGM